MKLDLSALQVLDAVIAEGSFSGAAERLCKAQSAISYQIHKLEQQMGFEIFDRSGYRARLTPKGQVLWSEGRRMLELAERIETMASRYQEGWEPTLDLVIDASLPLDPVLKAMQALVERQIPTRPRVRVEALTGVQMRFEKERADLMLVKDYHPRPHLEAIELPAITLRLVVAAQHPLAKPPRISLEQLYDHVELTIQDSNETASPSDDPLQFGGERVFYMNGFMTKKQALMMGLGFGWMPEFMIEAELRSGQLVPLKAPFSTQVRFIPQLVFDSARPPGKAGEMLMDLVVSGFQQFSAKD